MLSETGSGVNIFAVIAGRQPPLRSILDACKQLPGSAWFQLIIGSGELHHLTSGRFVRSDSPDLSDARLTPVRRQSPASKWQFPPPRIAGGDCDPLEEASKTLPLRTIFRAVLSLAILGSIGVYVGARVSESQLRNELTPRGCLVFVVD